MAGMALARGLTQRRAAAAGRPSRGMTGCARRIATLPVNCMPCMRRQVNEATHIQLLVDKEHLLQRHACNRRAGLGGGAEVRRRVLTVGLRAGVATGRACRTCRYDQDLPGVQAEPLWGVGKTRRPFRRRGRAIGGWRLSVQWARCRSGVIRRVGASSTACPDCIYRACAAKARGAFPTCSLRRSDAPASALRPQHAQAGQRARCSSTTPDRWACVLALRIG